jgi:succinate dehydrogenase / fumarate reductase, cytochrome b subunit
MSLSVKFLDSSIGRKVVMSLTGLFLCSFLIVHVAGNLALFKHDEGMAFNEYTVFMTTFPPIKIISYLLYATVLLHAFLGFRLAYQNQKARPVKYKAAKDPRSSSWASKNMALLGTIILIFLVTHMANFWYTYKFGTMPWTEYTLDVNTGSLINTASFTGTTETTSFTPHESVSTDANGNAIRKVVVKDLYQVVKVAFRESWLVILYVLGMIAIAYHLVHGFQSAFQSIGMRPKTYERVIKGIGVWLFGIIIPLAFAAMPVYFYFFVKS